MELSNETIELLNKVLGKLVNPDHLLLLNAFFAKLAMEMQDPNDVRLVLLAGQKAVDAAHLLAKMMGYIEHPSQ